MYPLVYEAAKSGGFDSLKEIILGYGEDIFHQTTPKQNNILHVAAQYKQVNFISDLLQCPAGPLLLWQGNYRGDTPLHLAAKAGSWEAVRAFIGLAKSLRWVVEDGQVDACKELLRKPNFHKDTALHYALKGGHYRVVKLLIEEDPELSNITNAADESPLYLAVDRALPCSSALILAALPFSHKGPKGLNALHAALYLSQSSYVGILYKRPELIREADDMGWTPLHCVACIGEVELVRVLLQHDTSVAYDLDKDGQSALHIAAAAGHVNVIEELVRSCPDAFDTINTKGQTALHAAVMGGKVKVVKCILGMPNMEDLINDQDIDGNTALHLAALHRKYNIIYILARDKRVYRRATNKDHLTALDVFCAHNEVGYRAEKVHYLLRYTYGLLSYRGLVVEDVKRILDNQFVEDLPAVPIGSGSNTANQSNNGSSKRNMIEIQLLAAALIATVTFAAAITMPGGYNSGGDNAGTATLAGKAAFKAFVIFNTTAFVFSFLAIFLQFDTSWLSDRQQARYTNTAGLCIGYAIIGMVLAFGSGTYAVLSRTIGIGIIPYVMAGCLAIIYFIGSELDPVVIPGFLHISRRTYLRNLLFKYGIL